LETLKKILYLLIKRLMRAAYFCYYKKITVRGLDQLPVDKPLLILANHQNALMDALLMATYVDRAPYFLTRSDVFTNTITNALFNFLRMLPIYRFRDGRNRLGRNQEIFDHCADLLADSEAIVIFPEGNHNIKRRVRTLTIGFTRILVNAHEKYPDLDIRLVPVGINYMDASSFPDSAALNFGRDLSLEELPLGENFRWASRFIRDHVAARMRLLTIHIEDEEGYDAIVERLNALQVNYLDPEKVNALIPHLPVGYLNPPDKTTGTWFRTVWDSVFILLNFPVIVIWRLFVLRKVEEIEFKSTYRFLYGLIVYPIYLGFLFVLLAQIFNAVISGTGILFLFIFNLTYVKLR